MNSLLDDSLQVHDIDVLCAESTQAGRVYASGATRRKRDHLIVFFHGGGFVAGDLDEADAFLRRLARNLPDQVVLAANYTVATARPFPAAAEDAHAVLAWAKRNKAALGWSGKQLIVAGIEAGANLAAVSALMARDRAGPALAGQILIMPMLDPGLSSGSMRALPGCEDKAAVASACAAAYREYLPNAADRVHPYASPLQSSRMKGLPPALILSSEDDPLRDEAEQYGAKLVAAGVAATMVRMPAAPLQAPQARNECACAGYVLDEIATFIATLHAAP
jgi:acetyl esterase/lipase